MAEPQPPYPLFPPLNLLNDQARSALPINLEVLQRLEATPEHLNALATWRTGVDFLVRESAKPGFEERHYKKLCPKLESMMHWSWTIRDKPLHDWNSADAKSFMTFIMRPPITWVTTPGCSRYSKKTKQNFAKKSNDPTWRPIIRPTLTGGDPGLSSKHHRVHTKGPGLFESPLYLRRGFALAPRFEGYFQRYAHFRYIKVPAVSSQSFLFPQENGLDAYGYGSLIEIFSEFCASILSTLRSRPKATLANWKGSYKFDPEASLTFNELRASAKRAGMIPKSTAPGVADEDPSVWPDIGIRQGLSRRIVFNFVD